MTMKENEIIFLNEYCNHHQIDHWFVYALRDSGLIEVSDHEEQICIPEQQLPQFEKMTRLYYEMGINLEGIETIIHLLNRMKTMQETIEKLNNRLKFYEPEI